MSQNFYIKLSGTYGSGVAPLSSVDGIFIASDSPVRALKSAKKLIPKNNHAKPSAQTSTLINESILPALKSVKKASLNGIAANTTHALRKDDMFTIRFLSTKR